jgi:SulP family sulfate permease
MLQKIKSNWKSGLTVALVSIPLSISLAVASHVAPIAGIITAIWAGLIASIFGGSNFNIIGPTGALSGIIASYVLMHGPETVSMLAILTGIVIMLAYALHFERYLVFIPSSVIHGFTLGVAFIIALSQLNYALGLQGLPIHHIFIKNVWQSIIHIPYTSVSTLFIFLIFFVSLLFMRKRMPTLPGTIIVCPFGIALGYAAQKKIIALNVETLGTKFGSIQAKLFQMPSISLSFSLISASFVVALIAILETMLSAKIADSMTKTRHDSRKEMFGLGLSNIASGMLGGIPATAALARTSLNIKTGATDKISAMISSIFIAIFALLFLSYFIFLPMPVVAAILVNIAYRMIEAEHFERLWHFDKSSFFIAMLVAAMTIYKDPIIGILVGVAVSLLLFVEKLSHGQYELTVDYTKDIAETVSDKQISDLAKQDDVLVYSFKGKLAYINSQAHIARFETDLKPYKSIILRMREVYFIDIDGIDALDEIIEIIEKRGQQVLITNVSPHIQSFLRTASKKFKDLEKKGLVFNKTSQALAFLGLKSY